MNTPSEVSSYSNSGKGLQGLERSWKSPTAFAGLYPLVCESSHRWPSSWESCFITTSRRSPGDGGLGGGVVCGCAGWSLPGSPVTTGNEWAYLNPTRYLDLGWNPITSPISKEAPQTPKNWQCAHSLFASTPCNHTKYTRPPNRENNSFRIIVQSLCTRCRSFHTSGLDIHLPWTETPSVTRNVPAPRELSICGVQRSSTVYHNLSVN